MNDGGRPCACEHSHDSAAPAPGDLRPVNTRVASESHETIRSARAKTTRAVTRVRLIHQFAELHALFLRGRTGLQEHAKPLYSMMLVDRMRRRLPNGVVARGIDPRDRVRDAGEASEKERAVYDLRDGVLKRRLPLRWRHVGEVAAPLRVINVDAALRARSHGEPRRIGDDAITHERTHAHGTVIRSSHFVSDAGIDAPHLELRREYDGRLQLRGLAEQREQAIPLAAGRGHLIHHSAGRADDEILDHLTEQREVTPLERHTVHRAYGVHRRDLERRGRAHTLSEGNGGVDEDACTVAGEPALPRQHDERSYHVRRPAPTALRRQERARFRILQRGAARREALDGHSYFDVRGIAEWSEAANR